MENTDLVNLVERLRNESEHHIGRNAHGNSLSVQALLLEAAAAIESLAAQKAQILNAGRLSESEAVARAECDKAEHSFSIAIGELIKAEAERDALQKDAERYRWLRKESDKHVEFYTHEPRWMVSVECGGTGKNYFGEKIDAAIDAALANPAAHPSP